MGACCGENGSSFKKGEQFFFQKLDGKSDYKIELYFTLMDVINPSKYNSFEITIINNKKLNIETYLGELEERSGKEIKYGTSFKVSYYFQKEQILIIEPKINQNLTGNRKTITLSQLIQSPKKGNCYIFFEEVGKLLIKYKICNEPDNLSDEISSFNFGLTLKDPIFLDPLNLRESFFIIYILDNKTKRPLYKSREFNDLNFYSNSIDIPSNLLIINNEINTKLYIALYCPFINRDKIVGYGEFNYYQINSSMKADKNQKVQLIRRKCFKDEIIGYVDINYNKRKKISFMDYLRKGMRINLDFAIDYTYSNIGPDNPIPLHHADPRYPNDYIKAIESCRNIAKYDYDGLFPVYGFGAKPNGSSEVNHRFNINFKDDPNIEGIDNIIKAYKESLSKIEYFYPTYFHEVIDKVIKEVKYDMKYHSEENHYYILLILTDGNMNDSEQTRDKIIEASNLPISIIIVGIGGEDFDFNLMKMLDGNNTALVGSKGKPWKRDIVHFVQFNKFKGDDVGIGSDLTDELFKEVPGQIEEYYQKVGKFVEWAV